MNELSWWALADSNRRPMDYESTALTAVLRALFPDSIRPCLKESMQRVMYCRGSRHDNQTLADRAVEPDRCAKLELESLPVVAPGEVRK